MSKFAMISQPMGNKTDAEIREAKDRATRYLEENGYSVLDTLFEFDDELIKNSGVNNIPVFYLAKSIEELSKASVVYFCDGWEKARGCWLEHSVCKSYGIPIIYEKRPSWL